MSSQKPPFDPHALADWLTQGLKETVSYRIAQTFDRDKWLQKVRDKIPTRSGALHFALKRLFEKFDFKFEEFKQGDAKFYVVRKKFRDLKPGQEVRRLVMVPGFGDSPASWLTVFASSFLELEKRFDEIVVLDFPGYMGFLSGHAMVPSMEILISVAKTVCEAYRPTVLIGHSLGGWLAAKVAQATPHLMDQLILIAPAGLIPSHEERERFGKFILSNQDIEPAEMLGRIIHKPKRYHSILNHDLKQFFSGDGLKQFVESVTEAHFVDQTKPFSARKLTVIWGEKDLFVPSQGIRDWVEAYGLYLDAFILKDTGHLPQLERPLATSDLIFQSIAGTASKSTSDWLKIQSRRMEWANARLDQPANTKLLSG